MGRKVWSAPSLVRAAAFSLFLFVGLNAAAFTAWFLRAYDPWNYKSIIEIASVLLALLAALGLRFSPNRGWVHAGLGALAVSLLRLGPPADWTLMSALVFNLTVLLSIPLARLELAAQRSPDAATP